MIRLCKQHTEHQVEHIVYTVRGDRVQDETGQWFDTYGIECKTVTVTTETTVIPDIALDLNKVQNWVKIMNDEQLSVAHFNDVVEDIAAL